MPGSAVNTLPLVNYLILTTYETGTVYSPFIDGLTEAQRGELTCPRSHSLNPADLRPGVLSLRTTDTGGYRLLCCEAAGRSAAPLASTH